MINTYVVSLCIAEKATAHYENIVTNQAKGIYDFIESWFNE
jgi:hypothetical protein